MQKSVVIQRILLAFAAGILIGLAVSELTFLFVGETARKPKTIAIVIPPGTADLVARGEQPPTLPQDMTFVVGDILSVENKDSVDHQLGPLWIPPGASGQLNLGEVASLAFDCSFQPRKDIDSMEWRAVKVKRKFDFGNQVALRNQYNDDREYGYHLITPLLFDRGAVLVDRGWIPAEGNTLPADWRKYDEVGQLTITGQIRLGGSKPVYGGVADPELSPGRTRLDLWNNLDLVRISEQIPYPILPICIQPNMDKNDAQPPIVYQPALDLTEGPHLGYALQWFSFATILFVGYLFYLRKQG